MFPAIIAAFGAPAMQIDPAAQSLPALAGFLDDTLGLTRGFGRATIASQGATSTTVKLTPAGEAADLKSWPILLPYTTATVGATGGPAVGDEVLTVFGTILGKLSR